MKKVGKLEVITGPMKSEKSLELILRAHQLEEEGYQYIAFSPVQDKIVSRATEEAIAAILIERDHPELISYYVGFVLGRYHQLHTVLIDEVQFYEKGIVKTVQSLLSNGINVVAAGLDQTYTMQPFGETGALLCLAHDIKKKKATCSVCGEEASRSQRLLNGQPAPMDAPIIIIEGSSKDYTYEPRCDSCFQ